ncbi:MAG: phosphatidate cytidylyltransferase [Desulfoplanes sp.]
MNLSSHQQRLATSLVLMPCIIWLIFQQDIIMGTALFVVSILGLYEYCTMFWKGRKKITSLAQGAGMAAIISLCIGPHTLHLAPLGLGLVFIFMALIFLKNYSVSPSDASFTDATLLLAGIIYLPLLLQLFRFLSPIEILFVFVSAFATDTGGFYAGCLWGKKKIWPQISPKKTWIGSLGGMLLTTILCLSMGIIWGKAPWWMFALLGILLNISAQLGDFFESALKRWAGVKDSGHLLPGHGGIMDRIDSLLFALPVYYLAASLHTFFY